MMKSRQRQSPPVSTSRRRLLLGTAALAGLALVPAAALAAVSGRKPTGPRVWLGQFDSTTGAWRQRPAVAMPEQAEQLVQLLIRGPRALVADRPAPALNVGIQFRNHPDCPFQLGGRGSPGGEFGARLHASSAAVAGVLVSHEADRLGDGEFCVLTNSRYPCLQPGRYLVLIDPGATIARPDWRALGPPCATNSTVACVPGSINQALVAISVDVTAA